MAKSSTAVFGGGCFWCVEAVYQRLDGVTSVMPGYAGGKVPNPTYEQVCTGTTGHAEVAQITFDADKTSYKELLEWFWKSHDPTTLNRQGPDTGTQYRSAIFYHTPEQQAAAEEIIREITTAKIWPAPIVTEVTPFTAFYKAEDYHQEYFRNNAAQPYCRAVVAPKVAKFRKLYHDRLKRAENVPLA